jgi:hypothetical protein
MHLPHKVKIYYLVYLKIYLKIMNQFTTETIINSFYQDAATKTNPHFLVVGNKFIAKKLFAFDIKDIKAIYKATAKDEQPEIATITLPTTTDPVTSVVTVDPHTYTFEGNTITSDVFRLHIEMKTVDANISEFQNSLTRNNKEYNFEVKYDATSGNMAIDFEKAIKMQNNESKNPKFKVSVSGNVLTLTSIDGFTRFNKIEVQALETNYLGYNAFTVIANGNITTPGESGFGTTNWLMRNFRIPTYVNTNWLSLRQDDRPIPGVKYNQYTFHVEADRGELTGMGAVGQKMTSKTTHVLYVAESASADLDALLTTDLDIPYVDYDKNNLGDESANKKVTNATTVMKNAASTATSSRTAPTTTDVQA